MHGADAQRVGGLGGSGGGERIGGDLLRHLRRIALGHRQHPARVELVDPRPAGAQREGLPGQRRARQLKVRLDLLRELVAEKERPAAGEGERGGILREFAALRAPPVLERPEEGGALRRNALPVHATIGQE